MAVAGRRHELTVCGTQQLGPAGVQEDDLVTGLQDRRRDDGDNGRAPGTGPMRLSDYPDLGVGVQGGGRLDEHECERLDQQRPGQGHALTLSAG